MRQLLQPLHALGETDGSRNCQNVAMLRCFRDSCAPDALLVDLASCFATSTSLPVFKQLWLCPQSLQLGLITLWCCRWLRLHARWQAAARALFKEQSCNDALGLWTRGGVPRQLSGASIAYRQADMFSAPAGCIAWPLQADGSSACIYWTAE